MIEAAVSPAPVQRESWHDLPYYICPACGYDTLMPARMEAHRAACPALDASEPSAAEPSPPPDSPPPAPAPEPGPVPDEPDEEVAHG